MSEAVRAEERETIKIKYFDGAQKIEKIEVGDWIDLRANSNVMLSQGERAMIPLGVAMELPKGYEALVLPRSSTFKTWGVIQTNHVGVIDESYCVDNDQWHFPCYCLMPTSFHNGKPVTMIKKGDRICQFRIIKHQPHIDLVEVESLGNEDRGGIGSTGTN